MYNSFMVSLTSYSLSVVPLYNLIRVHFVGLSVNRRRFYAEKFKWQIDIKFLFPLGRDKVLMQLYISQYSHSIQ